MPLPAAIIDEHRPVSTRDIDARVRGQAVDAQVGPHCPVPACLRCFGMKSGRVT
jgi:hypothetical protein